MERSAPNYWIKHPGFHILTVRHPDELAADASPKARAYAEQYYEKTMADPAFQAEVAKGKRRAVQVKKEDTAVSLTLSQCRAFEQRLEQVQFWRLSSCQPKPGLLDGASWLLEAHLGSSQETENIAR